MVVQKPNTLNDSVLKQTQEKIDTVHQYKPSAELTQSFRSEIGQNDGKDHAYPSFGNDSVLKQTQPKN